MGRLPVPQKKAVQLPVFLRKKNGLVPVSHRLFVEVFVSGNKSCLYGYDVPDTSIYQKDHWTGIPGSDSTILYLYVLDFFLGIKIQLLFFIWSEISTGTRRTEVKWS